MYVYQYIKEQTLQKLHGQGWGGIFCKRERTSLWMTNELVRNITYSKLFNKT